jgi:hypothetical protein
LRDTLRDTLRDALRGTFLQALFATALDQLFGSGHVIRLHRRFDLAEGKAKSLGLIIADGCGV